MSDAWALLSVMALLLVERFLLGIGGDDAETEIATVVKSAKEGSMVDIEERPYKV